MSSVSKVSVSLALKLLLLEGAHEASSDISAPAHNQSVHLVRVCTRLRAVLTSFAGAEGFRSLLARALTLAKTQDSSLSAVQVLADGSLAGTDTMVSSGPDPAGHIFVAQLLDLLIIFVGEAQTLQIVHTAWPEAPPTVFHSESKDL